MSISLREVDAQGNYRGNQSQCPIHTYRTSYIVAAFSTATTSTTHPLFLIPPVPFVLFTSLARSGNEVTL
jgi:hypothetical protein